MTENKYLELNLFIAEKNYKNARTIIFYSDTSLNMTVD
jgi:hypothetical protein